MVNESAWSQDLATVIDHIRLPSFSGALERLLATQCYFDTMLMITCKKSLKPIIISPTNPAEQSITLHNYINGAYILDPVFNAIREGKLSDGVSRLIDIAPDNFTTTEYNLSCYKEFDLIDEINLSIMLDNHVTCTICLGRRTNRGTITRAELSRLNKMYPVIQSLVRQFWVAQSQDYIQYEKTEGAIKQAMSSFARGVLTREQQVTGLMLQGHSSKAIARELSIREGANKSVIFSADIIMARYAKASAAKCLDLFKLADKVDDHSNIRPSGLSEKQDLSVNIFRRTTSMPVTVALISSFSVSQRRN
ncbi:LuxR family transcriptional regulator [Amphritea sp. 1_MG-2023]|uniref:LuxR family transcriptional regulator n=1 Tax=Amphritea sp. 1_MG-2023 TaxID=3062670 RepID=UPI0026E180E5|nr:LuxR family transcriptional regulator [Amphritea sp. 1_MG-2023]MDO6565246.1 LuxR family transcriptional regulator [Amphritea sp. 1_MG-2023]